MVRWTQNEGPILAGRRALVVDDWKDLTSLVADILTADGAQVSTAHTGQDAMAFLGGGRFDLLVLDLGMPKPDGWDVLEFIRKAVPHMLARTVVLTAMRYDREIAQALKDKGVAHMFKPFEIDSLRKAVCGLLSRAEPPLAA